MPAISSIFTFHGKTAHGRRQSLGGKDASTRSS